MKTEVKKIDSTKREIAIEVSGEIVKNKFEDVFNRVAKEAKVRGFRPGHVPPDILEKNYASVIHQQVLKELIPDVYNKAIEKEGLEVVELPNIFDVKLDKTILSFKATVEVSPEIVIKNYKGLKVNYQKITVSSDEIKRNIDSLKEKRTEDNIDDNFARSLSYPDLSQLKEAIERQILIQKENIQRERIENEIIEQLIKDIDFKLPQSLINRQLQDLVRQAKLEMTLKGESREKIEEQEKELFKQLEPQAKRQVKVYLVLAKIAKKENIPKDDKMPKRVIEFLLREANWDRNSS